ncbi:MAG TPA: protein-glutamate O-methyltransferase [Acidobacteriaceae bacterium]|jgi:chemotaxis protein methyltransferase CheR|nr:protein-glutamate O-methyltransferase [Acidobacteriaceae bacterium]
MSAADEILASRDFSRLTSLIYAEAGIRIGPEKKTMLEARLKRRLRALGIDSCARYCDYLFSGDDRSEETIRFIDVVTTNKTDFFREPAHFAFLAGRAAPEWLAQWGSSRPMLVWSAGCSTGEEPYTLAMVLSEYGEAHPGFRFGILATDISTAVLARAEAGIYSAENAEPIAAPLRRKYLMRSRDRTSTQVRVAPELRRLVEFRRLNFMDTDYGVAEPADAIFCRNVLIYFDRPTQEKILRRLAECLAPQGYLFVGHAETLHDLRLPLVPVAPALYRRLDGRS